MQASSMTATRPVTAPDGGLSDLPRYPCEGADVVRVGATSNVAGTSLAARVVFWDGAGNLAAITAPVRFTADPRPVQAGLYAASPDPDAWFPIGGAHAFSVRVDGVTGGAWTVQAMAG